VVLCKFWLEQLAEVGLEPAQRALLVDLHEMAVADDIGDQDGGKATFHRLPLFRAVCTKRLMVS
jgi:hypothetical protein